MANTAPPVSVPETAPLSVPPEPGTPNVGLDKRANGPVPPPRVPCTSAFALNEAASAAEATRALTVFMFHFRSDEEPNRRVKGTG